MTNTRTSLALASLAAALAFAPAAFANPTVTWSDLDTSTEAGRAELDKRIDAAARAVCTQQVRTGTIITRSPSARCLATAREQISAKIAARLDGPALAAGSAPSVASAR